MIPKKPRITFRSRRIVSRRSEDDTVSSSGEVSHFRVVGLHVLPPSQSLSLAHVPPTPVRHTRDLQVLNSFDEQTNGEMHFTSTAFCVTTPQATPSVTAATSVTVQVKSPVIAPCAKFTAAKTTTTVNAPAIKILNFKFLIHLPAPMQE